MTYEELPEIVISSEEKDMHHLFTKPEIKKALIRIFGYPKKDTDYIKLDNYVKKCWNCMPRFYISKILHAQINKNKNLKIITEIKGVGLNRRKKAKIRTLAVREFVKSNVKDDKKDKFFSTGWNRGWNDLQKFLNLKIDEELS
jgi:hypothetical protein